MTCTRLAIVTAIVVGVAGCQLGDDCINAVARLDRIEAARGPLVHHPRWLIGEALRECREHVPDPVLGCVLANPTDDAARACIDRFLHDVIGGPPDAPGDGKGLNPLLDDD